MMKLFSKSMLIGLAVVISAFSLWIYKKPVVFKRPNIILFSADTLRADHLSCYGYFRKTSPNIDAVAKDSVLFQNAISQSPITEPAHMSIFTSLAPSVHSIKCLYNKKDKKVQIPRLNEKIETLPLLLKRNGYLTLGFHGGTNMDGAFGFDKGFDRYEFWGDFLESKNELEDVQQAIQESKEKKKPLFLFLHNYICHSPYLRSPPEFNLKFLSERVAGLPMPEGDWRIGNPIFCSTNFWKNVDISNPQHLQHIISLYDGGISYEDHIWGEVIKILKEEKLYDNSIIIFLSDHGEEFYEHLGKEHGRLFIEHLHVPLIIKFPGNRFGGRVIREWVRTMDILPTLFDFLNIKIKNMIQGVSFIPLITGRGSYSPLIVSYKYKRMPGSYEVRFIKEPFAYSSEGTYERSGDGTSLTKGWLFDIRKDPLEKDNLAVKDAKVTDQMRFITEDILAGDKAFREKIGSQPTVFPMPEDNGLVAHLRSLGYLQ